MLKATRLSIPLETTDGTAYHQKTDVYRRLMWYSFGENDASNFFALSVERVNEIIEANKKNIKFKIEPEQDKEGNKGAKQELDFKNVVGQESLTRFDEKKGKNKNRR